jgi:hypothetical protein
MRERWSQYCLRRRIGDGDRVHVPPGRKAVGLNAKNLIAPAPRSPLRLPRSFSPSNTQWRPVSVSTAVCLPVLDYEPSFSSVNGLWSWGFAWFTRFSGLPANIAAPPQDLPAATPFGKSS